MSYKDSISYPAIFVIFLALFGIGCETEFDPLQERDRYPFSMYGFLDLHADTQWVRVMPVLDSLVTHNPEPIDAHVTLTREMTGETTVLDDSLFFYGSFAYAWNYRTAEPPAPAGKVYSTG